MSKTALKPWAKRLIFPPSCVTCHRSPWSLPKHRGGHLVLQGLVTVGRFDGASDARSAGEIGSGGGGRGGQGS